jgi:hypothetical protein
MRQRTWFGETAVSNREQEEGGLEFRKCRKLFYTEDYRFDGLKGFRGFRPYTHTNIIFRSFCSNTLERDSKIRTISPNCPSHTESYQTEGGRRGLRRVVAKRRKVMDVVVA